VATDIGGWWMDRVWAEGATTTTTGMKPVFNSVVISYTIIIITAVTIITISVNVFVA
jgi:hypothetical protein